MGNVGDIASDRVVGEASTPVTFAAPGPGSWMLDTTHHGSRPITRFMWPLQKQAFEEGLAELTKRYGLPLAGAVLREVHGLGYIRMLAVGEKVDSSAKPPPMLLLKLLARLHPELRRRNKTAAAALANRAWRRDVAWWFDEQRTRAVEGNLALQAVEVASLSDDDLAKHLDDLVEHFTAVATASFANHGGDLIPVGLFLSACSSWGIPAGEASAALRGSSPATIGTHHLLAPVAAAIAEASEPPTTMADVRALGDDVAAAIDDWLNQHGWRLLTSDDIDAPTLAELPALQLRSLLAAQVDQGEQGPPDISAIRDKVPAQHRADFDSALTEARHGLTQRDDAVGVAWNWPAGLIRRALLEVGRRLVERGGAHDAQHAVELAHDEVPSALAVRAPSADELARRRMFRDNIELANPPALLGPEEEPPPLEAFPRPMATMTAAVLATIDAMEYTEPSADLVGVGVGTAAYRGRACVVQSPVDAMSELEAGDVLVVPFTSPSYNSVFPLVGAMVTNHGGPMSHTAIMAREFGVPAVVGTGVATAVIPHGALVEVDPATSTVRVIE